MALEVSLKVQGICQKVEEHRATIYVIALKQETPIDAEVPCFFTYSTNIVLRVSNVFRFMYAVFMILSLESKPLNYL